MAGVDTPRPPTPPAWGREETGTRENQPNRAEGRPLKVDALIAAYRLAAAELEQVYREDLQAAQSSIARLEARQGESLDAIEQRTAEAAYYRGELERLRSSTSWRVSAPLRLFKLATLWVAKAATRLTGSTARALPAADTEASSAHSPEQRDEIRNPASGLEDQTSRKGAPKAINTIRSPAEIAVILHLHYADLVDELCAAIANIPEPFHLYVSVTVQDAYEDIAQQLLAIHPECAIHPVENRGRDILPLLEWLPQIVGKYPFACKLHSKKSAHSPVGERWRKDMLIQLLGGPGRVESFLACFRANPELGLIGPDGFRLTENMWWREERPRVMELAQIMSVPTLDRELDFFAGSMFWFRPAALKPIVDLGLTAEDFPAEAGQMEGTLANALERCFSMSAKAAGFRVTDTAEAIVAARGLAQSRAGA